MLSTTALQASYSPGVSATEGRLCLPSRAEDADTDMGQRRSYVDTPPKPSLLLHDTAWVR